MPLDNQTRSPGRPVLVPLGAALAMIALTAHLPSLRCGFIWDDREYVTNNRTMLDLDGLKAIWFQPRATPQYYPLVLSSFWIEHRLWGLAPTGFHLTNVLLHAVNVVLLWVLLRRLGVPGAWLAAAVFAAHPVHVESVAWITERKNVLSGLFYLAAFLAYLEFCMPADGSRPAAQRRRWYGLAVALFVCALLSKTVTCSLPAAILLVVWWKRGRLSVRDVGPLVPLFFIGVVMGLLTTWLERLHVGAVGEDWDFSAVERCLIAGRAVWFYAGKLVYPAGLTFNYPRWTIDAGVWWQYLYPAGVLAVVLLLWLLRARIGRGPLVAVLFFIGTLAPALGFINIYLMRFSFVADHFAYLPSIGLIALLAAAVTRLCGALTSRAGRDRPRAAAGAVAAVAVVVLSLFGWLTWRRCAVYETPERLWRDTLARNPSAWMAHNNLGRELLLQGKGEEAMRHFNAALSLKPNDAELHNNTGSALQELGRLEEAIVHFERAIELRPNHHIAHSDLGVAYARLGKSAKAIEHFRKAVESAPGSADVRFNLAAALYKAGQKDEAEEVCRKALELNPRHGRAHFQMAELLAARGQTEAAIEHYLQAARLLPQSADARYRLAIALAGQGRREEAVQWLQATLQIDPLYPGAQSRLDALSAGGP